MARPLCPSCNLPMRIVRALNTARSTPTTATSPIQSSRPLSTPTRRTLTSKSPQTPNQILSKPTWSVTSLLDSSPSPPSVADEITPQKLHHLLRLSALPLPATPQAEASLLDSLRAHLRFVREIQAVDTTGVEPLRALRDETAQGRQDTTVRLQDLQDALVRETRFGHRKRPRRGKTPDASTDEVTRTAEDWNPLKTAGRTAGGKYFVVQNRKAPQ